MNHQRIYESIVQNAKSENRIRIHKNQKDYLYYEEHHIIPRCLEGIEEQENKVLLTAKEHYVCHKLLTYIYSNSRPICVAFFMMSNACKNRYIISSRDYAYAKELFISLPMTKETKEKHRKAALKRIYLPLSEEHKLKLKLAITGKKRSVETRKKMSLSQMGQTHNKGKGNPMFGKSVHDIWIEKYGKEEADKMWVEKTEKQRKKILETNIKKKYGME